MSPSSALVNRCSNNLSVSISIPAVSKNSRNNLTQALISEEQLFACTIPTKSPEGVVTKSISGYTLCSSFSKTIIANTEVPADTFPVRLVTLFVATIPVPASPSGGHKGIPGCRFPVGSRSCAPSFVRYPASSPANKI